MDKKINNLEKLVDPVDQSKLIWNQSDNSLNGKNGKYKIINSIPSFVNQSEFEEHWETNSSDSIPEKKLVNAERFLQPAMKSIETQTEEVKILDAGCGDGIHLLKLSQNLKSKNKNVIAFGVDSAISGLTLCKSRLSNNWPLIQASVDKLPFKDNFFDTSFSYGVLAYTLDPYKSLMELERVTKIGGEIGIWIYPKKEGFVGALFNFTRKVAGALNPFWQKRLADVIVPFLPFLPINSKLNLGNATWNQCREIVMVNIIPDDLKFYSEKEIKSWFTKLNLEIMESTDVDPITVWSIKRK
jgi:ubiquinone/menaquinone biosynthesis C-methylase UbiE